MLKTKLTVLDEFYLQIANDNEPVSIQFEIGISGSFNEEKLSVAILKCLSDHPMLRVKLKEGTLFNPSLCWEIVPCNLDTLMEAFCIKETNDVEEANAIRNEFYSQVPDLSSGVAINLLLIKMNEGDRLLLNLHHAALDGVSAYCLIKDLICHYNDNKIERTINDPLKYRDLKKLAQADSVINKMDRLNAGVEMLKENIKEAPVKIFASGKKSDKGFSFQTIELSIEESKNIVDSISKPATVNDALMSALLNTIAVWNKENGVSPGRISGMMPVNIRPKEWFYEVMGNYATYLPLSIAVEQQGDIAASLWEVCAQSQRFKHYNNAGMIVDGLTLLPKAVRLEVPRISNLLNDRLTETTVLSNLGKIEFPTQFDGAGEITTVQFSPPCAMPLGVAVGVVMYKKQLRFSIRSANRQLNLEDQTKFRDILEKQILSLIH